MMQFAWRMKELMDETPIVKCPAAAAAWCRTKTPTAAIKLGLSLELANAALPLAASLLLFFRKAQAINNCGKEQR